MKHAETGFNLEIDLSRGSIDRVETDPRDTEVYLGGLGTNAKILWDRVPPEVEPFSPENLLIFGTGLLCGTHAPSANRTIISTFSPQTLLMAFSMMGGFFGPELKHAGYDKIVIRGKSPSLVYLWINNDKVEIRDASHFHGKGALETAELIREELNEPKAQVAAIGLAGENRVYYASVESGKASCSRLGVGAVMGSKGLKAIAVRGKEDLSIARPDEFMEICNEVLDFMKYRLENPLKLPPGMPAILAYLGIQEMSLYDEEWHANNFAWGNARYRRKDFWTKEVEEQWRETQEKSVSRLIACFNCPIRCGGSVSYKGVRNYMMKCYSKLTYTMAALSDLEFGFKIAGLAQDYGVDGFTAPQVMAFAVELYEAGILTDEDMPGFPSRNEDRFFYLLEKIVRREGIGDALANGIYWAARRIGKGAEAYDHNTIKKHEQLPLKLGVLNPIYYLMYCTGEKINITQFEGQFPQTPHLTREEREEFSKDWIQVPHERMKEYFINWEPRSFPHYPPPEAASEIVDWQEIMHYIDDATGICAAVSSFVLKPPYHIHNLPLLISSATGLDIDEAGLWEIAKRNRILLRSINIRRGLRRRDEKPPEDHWKKRFPELEAKLLDEYYRFKGWNREGIPTKETLDSLGLGYVKEDFVKRGILPEDERPSSKEGSA
mgnify:CR=1 FL=1